MNIGDIFFGAHLIDGTLVTDAKRAGDKAGAAAGKSMSSRLSREVKTGIGLGGGFAAFNLIGTAITKVTGYLGDSAEAFKEDQVSIQRMTTSLRANIDGWDGNTKAIEKRISAGQKLGFSDEEQRKSLGELVGAYHDVAKSLDVMRTAEDLARFSGVDLATASDVLIKVHAGNFRALKALGINTKDIKDETQALAAIQKVAAGQAEDYAQTIEGKLVVAEEKANEASEKFGKSIARLQAVALPAAADAIEALANNFDFFQTVLDDTATPLEKLEAALAAAKSSQIANTSVGKDLIANLEAQIAAYDRVSPAARGYAAKMDGLETATNNYLDDGQRFRALLKGTADAASRASDEIDGLTTSITDGLFGGHIRAAREASLKQEFKDLVEERSHLKVNSIEWLKLTGQISENQQAMFELHLEQAASAGPLAAIDFLKKEKARTKGATDEIDKLIQRYKDLAALQQTVQPIIRVLSGRYAGKALPEPRASGGPTAPFQAYRVGEHGEETLLMGGQPGYVWPDPMAAMPRMAAAGAASGGGNTYNQSTTLVIPANPTRNVFGALEVARRYQAGGFINPITEPST